MYVRGGLAQSATYAAAAVLQDPGGDDAGRAASAAKLLAGEAAIDNAAPRSRCSAAWASPGTCSPTTSSSGRGCWSRPSAPPTTTPLDLGADARRRRRGDERAAAGRRRRGRRRRAAHRHRPARRARTRSTRPRSARIVEALEAAATDDSLRAVLLTSTGRRLLLRRRLGAPATRRRAEAPARQHPAPHAAAGPPPHRAARWRSSSGRVRRAGLGRRASAASSRSPPTSPSPPTTAASGSRSSSGASPPTAGRPGCCPGSSAWPGPRRCCSSAGRSPVPTPRTGG